MSDKPYEGGCLCGAIRYRATSAPIRGVMCHCPQCRKSSGAPALTFVHFPAKSFMWLKGEPKRYQSSEYAQRGFCPDCGSTLSMDEEVLADRMLVTIGSLDEPGRAHIDDHVWTKDRVPWFDTTDKLPRFDTNSSAVKTKAFDA
jgi:hypothetical protein